MSYQKAEAELKDVYLLVNDKEEILDWSNRHKDNNHYSSRKLDFRRSMFAYNLERIRQGDKLGKLKIVHEVVEPVFLMKVDQMYVVSTDNGLVLHRNKSIAKKFSVEEALKAEENQYSFGVDYMWEVA
jgi:hypothetical protein